MTELPYYAIPDFPEEKSATSTIARFIDGLGFRYQLATEGLTEQDIQFRPVEGSMDMMELLDHIYRMAVFTNRFFGGPIDKAQKLESFSELRSHTLNLYAELSSRLKKMEDTELDKFNLNGRFGVDHFPFWYFLNGPIADALTHVGQITSWRRINGNPQPKGANVFLGK
jgi:hypothetical protein